MATADRTLAIEIKAVIDQLVGPVKTADGAIQNFAKNTTSALDQVEERSENLRHVWKSLFEAFIGVEIVNVLKKIADGANDAAEKLEIAANTAKNFGNTIDPNAMEKWLQAFAASPAGGGFALPDMRQGVQTFSAIGLDSNQIKRATADATNLAATFGFSLPEAIDITRNALTGHVEMLSRYGIITREAAKNIHTVEDAMRALERASAGGAEKRADGLAGAFGRLGNSISNLGNAFGKYLIPYFTATANGLDHLAEAFEKLPDWVQKAAAGISFATLSLAAFGLMLPTVKLGAEFVGNALALLGTPMALLFGGLEGVTIKAAALADVLPAIQSGAVTAEEGAQLLTDSTGKTIGIFGVLEKTIVGPVMSAVGALLKGFIALAVEGVDRLAQAFLGMSLSTLRGVVVSSFQSVMGAIAGVGTRLLGLLAPIGAVIAGWAAEAAAAVAAWIATVAPIAAVIAAIALIGLAIYEVVKHWDVFKDAAANALKWVGDRIHDFVDFVQQQFRAVGEILKGVWDFLTGNKKNGLAEMQLGLQGVKDGWLQVGTAAFEAGKKGVEAVNGWLQSQGWFRSIENAVKGFFSGSTGKAPPIPHERFTGEIPGGTKGKDTAEKAADNALKNFTTAAESWLAAFQAKIDAAQATLDISKAKIDAYKATLPGGKPQTDSEEAHLQGLLNNELKAEQSLRDATVAKQNAQLALAQKYETIAKSVSKHLKNHDALVRDATNAQRQHNAEAQKLAVTIAQIAASYAQIGAEVRNTRVETIQAQADLANDRARIANDAQLNAIASQVESVEHAKTMAAQAKGGTLDKVSEAAYNVQLAQLALAAETDKEALAQHTATVDANRAAQTHTVEDQTKAADAQNAATAATNSRIAAEYRLNEAEDLYTKALKDRTSLLTKALDELVKKLNVPGLTQNANGIGFSFNPMQFLLQAFEQTKAFGDIMATVNQIVKVFVQILDDLRPVIDLLLAGLRAVANVFIFLYDTVARILRLFGIHLQLINSLNAAYGNIPLIQITHNIPTLNELAAGKLKSPLSNVPQGYNSLSDIGNVHTTLLQSILGTLVAILAVESLFGHGHGGGFLGGLGNLFHFGGHGGGGLNMSGVAPTGDLVASMSKGVASGLGVDGNTSSGGMFTAMSSGMKAASPVLAALIGAAIGGSAGGGIGSIFGAVGSVVGTSMGGPIGGLIGGIVGGLFSGLFGHHKSAPAPGPQQTTEFTDLLHKATDVHGWMTNQLASITQPLAATMRSMQSASAALATSLGNLASTSANVAATSQVFAPNFAINAHIHDDRDVASLGRDLAAEANRAWRSYQWGVDRGPIG